MSIKTLEEFTIEFAADEFVREMVPEQAPIEQKHDMKVAFIAGVATLAHYQRRIEREAPERIARLLEAREKELNELMERYSAPVGRTQ